MQAVTELARRIREMPGFSLVSVMESGGMGTCVFASDGPDGFQMWLRVSDRATDSATLERVLLSEPEASSSELCVATATAEPEPGLRIFCAGGGELPESLIASFQVPRATLEDGARLVAELKAFVSATEKVLKECRGEGHDR